MITKASSKPEPIWGQEILEAILGEETDFSRRYLVGEGYNFNGHKHFNTMQQYLERRYGEAVRALLANEEYTVPHRIIFREAQFRDIKAEGVFWPFILGKGAVLDHCTLNGANLNGADFGRAGFKQAKMIKVQARKAFFSGAILASADLTEADLIETAFNDATLQRAKLRKANLHNAKLRKANLQYAILEDADLSGADLSGANLSEANLVRANLSGANLTGATLVMSNLTSANFTGAVLTRANFGRAHTDGMITTDANVTEAVNLRLQFSRDDEQPEPLRAALTDAVKPLFAKPAGAPEPKTQPEPAGPAAAAPPPAPAPAGATDSATAILSGAGAAPPPVAAPAPAAVVLLARALKQVDVIGLQLVRRSAALTELRPFNRAKPGLSLALAMTFNGPVLKVSGGLIERAILDSGKNHLDNLENARDRQFRCTQLTEDRLTALCEIVLEPLPPGVKTLREVSGLLLYEASAGAVEADLGFAELTAGAQGTDYGAHLETVAPCATDPSRLELALRLDLPLRAVETVRCRPADGPALEVQAVGESVLSEHACLKRFTLPGPLPPAVRLFAVLHRERQQLTVPFAAGMISLAGLF